MGLGAMIGGTVLSGVIGGVSASKAANAQQEAAEATVKEQRRQFDLMRSDTAPYRSAGYNALAAMQYEMGLGPMPGSTGAANVNAAITTIPGVTTTVPGQNPYGGDQFDEGADRNLAWNRLAPMSGQGMTTTTSPTRYSVNGQMFDTMDAAQGYANTLNTGAGNSSYVGFQETPGYQFQLEQGQKALERNAAARGIRLGGASMQEAQRMGQGYANQEYGNYYNRLAGLAGVGQTAVGTSAQVGQNTANSIGNALMAGGDARASGYQGMNNAFQGAMGNMFSIYGMKQAGMFN